MSKRVGGFINQDGLNAPDEPTNVSASGAVESATVSFTSPVSEGGSAITGYVVTSNDGIGASGSASPITVTGLTDDVEYTFRVWAINAFGWSAPSATASATPGAVGFFIASGRINKISIGTTGNATDFGGTVSSSYNAGCSSSTRMLIGRSTITYVEFATGGAQSTFGIITTDFTNEIMGLSNQTRGLFAGGNRNFNQVNTIDYVTIATTGDALDFGDMTLVGRGGGGFASSTRGVMGALFSGGGEVNTINYVTIATTGNAIDFGDMTQARVYAGGCSNATRGLWGGGSNIESNRIDYVTIATTGNATDFGDLTQARREGPGACSSLTRGVWAGGYAGSSYVNTIDYITIATTGNATDFGDLLSSATATGASNAHGGLS